MVVVPLTNPLADPDTIVNTPSRRDGVPEYMENDLRSYGAILIQQAGTLLSLPQVVTATACILYQRFWFVTSFRNFGIKDIVLSAVFLAAKLEEQPVRLRDIVNVFDYLFKKAAHEHVKNAFIRVRQVTNNTNINTNTNTNTNTSTSNNNNIDNKDGKSKLFDSTSGLHDFTYEPMDYYEQEFYTYRDLLSVGEMQILKRLGFDLTVVHPYGALVNYLQVLNLASHSSIPQCAWSFCNDMLLTPLLAMYPHTNIATCAIYLATLLVNPVCTLPNKWWEVFDVEDEHILWDMSKILLNCYKSWGVDIADSLLNNKDNANQGSSSSNVLDIWSKAATKTLPLSKEDMRAFLSKNT